MRSPVSARIPPITVPTMAPAGKYVWLSAEGGVGTGTAIVDVEEAAPVELAA